MKKFFLSSALVIAVGLINVSANDTINVDNRVKQAFDQEFPQATSVRWNRIGGFQQSNFDFYGQLVVAYFSSEGELMGSFRYISFDRLPMPVIKAFERRFAGALYLVIREILNAEGTSYRLTLQLQHERYNVKADPDGNLSEIKKLKMEKARASSD